MKRRISATILFAAAVWAVPMLAAAPPATGLRGHRTMDDPAGSSYAADSSPDLNHAFCGFGYLCPFGGNVGVTVTFNGNSFLAVRNSIPNSFTMAAWIKWIKTTDYGGGWGPAYSSHGVISADVAGDGPAKITFPSARS